MIETLIELVERDIEEASGELANLLAEQRQIRSQAQYWAEHMALRHGEDDMDSAAAIGERLRFGARADQELKMLGEKDFLVEERITTCQRALLELARKKDALQEVLARRQQVIERTAKRRHERDMAQRGMARRLTEEVGRKSWR